MAIFPFRWPFRFQHQVIGGSTALTCVVLDQVVRKIFLLGRYKPLVTLLPTLVIPSVTSMLGFGLGVTHKILVGDGDCISCFAIRGGGFQMLLATVYPLLLSPLSCYLLAREYHTYGGHFNKNQVELIKMLRVPKGAKSLVGALMIGNYLLGAFLAYNQVQCFDNVLTKPNQPQNEDLKGLEWIR